MSALTDLFQSMANKIRSKTGTATTYTPPQMVADGIDDVFDAGVASATTPITPSDSSPVAMSANTGYKPTTNGYAIESQPTSITPSNSSPVNITSGGMYRATANGKAISSYSEISPDDSVVPGVQEGDIVKIINRNGFVVKTIPNPEPLTPSNSSPADIVSGETYAATANGKAVESVTSITPSNSSPVSLSSGSIYKPSSSGYAISSYSSKTPSDTSPASVTSGSIIKPSSNGYLYATQQTHELPEFTATAYKKDDKCYAKIGIDCTKYKTLKFTLSMSNASFSNSGEYLRIYSNGSSVSNLSTSAGTQTVTLQSSWGSDATINIFGHGTAAYGSITLSNIQLTPR